MHWEWIFYENALDNEITIKCIENSFTKKKKKKKCIGNEIAVKYVFVLVA